MDKKRALNINKYSKHHSVRTWICLPSLMSFLMQLKHMAKHIPPSRLQPSVRMMMMWSEWMLNLMLSSPCGDEEYIYLYASPLNSCASLNQDRLSSLISFFSKIFSVFKKISCGFVNRSPSLSKKRMDFFYYDSLKISHLFFSLVCPRICLLSVFNINK